MAVIKAISSGASIKRGIDYITNPEKTTPELTAAIGCSSDPNRALIEMEAVKRAWDKTGGRQYKHFSYNFPPGEQITPERALQNAVKLFGESEPFKGHQMIMAVHQDTDHLHVHVLVNSVNMEDGHKLQWSGADLRELKDRCNELSREQGLSVPTKGKTNDGQDRTESTTWSKDAYAIQQKAAAGEIESYTERIARCVIMAKMEATSREDFIDRLREQRIDTNWTDSRKHITFTDLDREAAGEKKCKLRNTTMEKDFKLQGYDKEGLERGFYENREASQRAERAVDRGSAAAPDRAADTGSIGVPGSEWEDQLREINAGIAAGRAAADNVGTAIDNSRADIEADNRAIRDRRADEARRQRELDKRREREIEARKRNSPTHER